MEEGLRSGQRKPMAACLALAALVAVIAAAAIGTRYIPGLSAHASPAGSGVGPVTIRWFVGLEGGTSRTEVAAEKAFVAGYNAANKDRVRIDLEIAQNTSISSAVDLLKTEVATGNSPDIVGPMGIGDRRGFQGLFLDLKPLIAARGIDLSVYAPGLVQVLQDEGSTETTTPTTSQVGIPYGVDPAFIFYNKDLFRKAGLPDLPTMVGQRYLGSVWDWNELASVAAKLTLDAAGRNAAQPGFDPGSIVQFGFDFPGTDARVLASTFGSGSFTAADGKTAQIPPAWADAFNWYYRAMWTRHVAPTVAQISQRSITDNPIAAGDLSMALSFPSEIGSYWAETAPGFTASALAGWGMAVVPSWKGQTTSPVGVTTFGIVEMSAHPDEAFSAMLAIEADPGLRNAYGRMPANPALQADWFAAEETMQSTMFPGNRPEWSVLQTMIGRAAEPTAEADLPGYGQAIAHYTEWLGHLQGTRNLVIKDELRQLQKTLQADGDTTCCSLDQ